MKPDAQPNKRALLIGVNKYPNLPDYSQLRGCVNDTQAMRNLLETSFGFPPANLRVLTDERATERGIRKAMAKLAADCEEGDIVVFHYSGHGSQMAAKGDKPRGYDESIMPYDSGRMNPDFPKQVEPRDIRDTEIQDWLSRLSQKTPHITLVFDSCHSGSITRLISDSEEAGTRLRWIAPDPLPAEHAAPASLTEERTLAREAGRSGWLPLSDKYVLLAACAAEQGAYELDHQEGDVTLRHGAFTFFLTQEIAAATAQSTYRDIWERVALKINNRFQKQTPQLEGTGDKLIFNVQDFAPMRYLLVTERRGDEVQLAGGAVHGLTIGSRWDIYPAGTKQTNETKDQRLGALEITSVSPVTAEAKIVEESPAREISAGARAVEVRHADTQSRLPVWLAPAPAEYKQEVKELWQVLAQSELLKRNRAARGARAIIRISFQNGTEAAEVSSARNKAPAQASWTILDQSQTLLMPQYPLHEAESKLSIRENLESIWRYQKVLELSHERSALKGTVNFVLLKRDAKGKWREVDDNNAVYTAGDSIAFRVVNRSEATVYASVLDLGLSRRINVLYPLSRPSEAIAVKRSGGDTGGAQTGGILSVGEREGDTIELFFPDNLNFLTAAAAGEPLRGKEFFKLIVTTRRHDLSFLNQSGLRKEPNGGPQHPLEKLIYLASSAGPMREARVKLEPQDEWFTIERGFWLQQKK